MIKHIVMMRVDKKFSADEKVKILNELKDGLNVLPSVIPEIKFYQPAINISESAHSFDLILNSEFENEKTLDIYRKHPEHVKFLNMSAKYIEEVAVGDYIL